MKFSRSLLLLTVAIMASSILIVNGAIKKKWYKTYTSWPQPIPLKKWVTGLTEGIFPCKSTYSLCAYAPCTWIPNSKPPMDQCGCYKFDNGYSYGAVIGTLNKKYQQKTKKYCNNPKNDCSVVNSAPMCKGMLNGKMHPAYDTVSTYNTTDWQQVSGTDEYSQLCDDGGIFALCYTAACRAGKPSNPLVSAPEGQAQFNSTCFCPLYKGTPGQTFLVANPGK